MRRSFQFNRMIYLKIVFFCTIFQFSSLASTQQVSDWKIVQERKTLSGAIASRLSVQENPIIIDSYNREAWTAFEFYEDIEHPIEFTKYGFYCAGKKLKLRRLETLYIDKDSKPGIIAKFDENWIDSLNITELLLVSSVCGLRS